MRIIAGKARNMELEAPPGTGVRPTLVRGRKALFDSLGIMEGCSVLDLFSGSGTLGLEAASRGAERICFVESSPAHIAVLRRNMEKVQRTGTPTEMTVLNADALMVSRYASYAPFDLVFADPPYAQSGEYFHRLCSDPEFHRVCGGAVLVWEIPDTPGARGEFLDCSAAGEGELRQLGGVWFCILTVSRL